MIMKFENVVRFTEDDCEGECTLYHIHSKETGERLGRIFYSECEDPKHDCWGVCFENNLWVSQSVIHDVWCQLISLNNNPPAEENLKYRAEKSDNDICREALKKATPATEEEKKAWTESGAFCSIRRFGRVRMPARLRID